MNSTSWPFAVLLLWALLRTFWNGIVIDWSSLQANVAVFEAGRARPLQLLVLLAMVGLLYVAARDLSPRGARWAAWGLAAGLVWEGLFGYLNLWGIYPWMRFVLADHVGRPMGFLTHPNYFGSLMALGLPVLWALGGILPVVAVGAIIIASWSGGPVISAAVAVAVCAWPDLSKRARYWLVGGAAAAVSAVMTVHEWRLSGRLENWAAIWPELARYPIIGQGLGSWRIWADQYNAKLSMQAGRPEVFATLQAHNEPYQLWFELGLIGLLAIACWVWQASAAVRIAWSSAAAPVSERAWWQPGRVPLDRAWIAVLAAAAVNSLGSPTFHLPAQAAIAVMALARCQAVAATAIANRGGSRFFWRVDAPTPAESLRRRRKTTGSHARTHPHPKEVSV